MWQDYVFAAGSLIFIVALVPSVIGEHKPEFWTSVLTSLVLLVFSITYWTLGLNFGAATTVLASNLWGVLALQVLEKR